MASHAYDSTPAWSWAVPAAASALLALKFGGLVPADAVAVLVLATLLLGGAVFAAVHHAEVLALRLGEPFGSILLAIAVTVIEVALIVSVLLGESTDSGTIARDTVFAAVMIVLGGIVGLCLLVGGQRHHEQTFRLQGTNAALAVIGTLGVLALVLPNYTITSLGPHYSPFQLFFVGAVSLALYGVFVFVQTVRHRDYFLDPDSPEHHVTKPPGKVAAASALLLIVALVAVVLLAKILSSPLDRAVTAAGLPHAVVGVVIAAVVLLPEGLAAVKAAAQNRLQSSMNLALGSAMASIGLTIPAVAMVSLVSGQQLVLGIDAESTVLLILILYVSALTLGTGRTTVLQGAVHLVVFAVFLLLAAVP